MHSLTRRQREILEIATANDGSITVREAGATELNDLVQMGYLNVAPKGSFRITSAGTAALDEPVAEAS